MKSSLARVSLLGLCLIIPVAMHAMNMFGMYDTELGLAMATYHAQQNETVASSYYSYSSEAAQPAEPPTSAQIASAPEPAPPAYVPDQSTIAHLQQQINDLKNELKSALTPPPYTAAPADSAAPVPTAAPAASVVQLAEITTPRSAQVNGSSQSTSSNAQNANTNLRGNPYVRRSSSLTSISEIVARINRATRAADLSAEHGTPARVAAFNSEADEINQVPCRKKVCTPGLKCFKCIRNTGECFCCSNSCTHCDKDCNDTECCGICYNNFTHGFRGNSFTACLKSIWNCWSYWCCSQDCTECWLCCYNTGDGDNRCYSSLCKRPEKTGSCNRRLERVGKSCERACFSQGCIKATGANDDNTCCSYFCTRDFYEISDRT